MKLATSILENGGKTPWIAPKELKQMGYSMIFYPTTVIFQVTKAIEKALRQLKSGKPIPGDLAVDMDQFMKIVDLPYWQKIEEEFEGEQL